MYQLLVPVDDDVDKALAQVEFIIDLPVVNNELSVTVAHAYRDAAQSEDIPPEQSPAVTKALESLREAGISAEPLEIFHPPTEGILDAADDIQPNQIVIGGRKRTPTGKALFGSTTQHVILNADQPVTVIRDDQ
jgi:nucleotide-binding universal stress UspA family protein